MNRRAFALSLFGAAAIRPSAPPSTKTVVDLYVDGKLFATFGHKQREETAAGLLRTLNDPLSRGESGPRGYLVSVNTGIA